MSMIDIKNLSFKYGNQSVLSNVNAQFYKGEMTVILGRNGSGKSTLFNLLTGIQQSYLGNILINQIERSKIKIGKSAGIKIGFMTQFHQTTFPFRVFDVVLTGRAFFSRFSPQKKDREMVEKVLKRFGLWHLKDKPYTTLSGGERQLILLCRILVQEPDVILLDEPTNHLDLHYQAAVLGNLKDLTKEGTTIICIMHDPNLAFLYADRYFIMQQQQLYSLQDIESEEMYALLEQAYQIPLEKITHGNKTFIIPSIHTSL